MEERHGLGKRDEAWEKVEEGVEPGEEGCSFEDWEWRDLGRMSGWVGALQLRPHLS